MNPSSLFALIVDQHSGELSSEVAELLEAYLSTHAPARVEAERIRRALSTTEETVLRYPDLGRVNAHESTDPSLPRRILPVWLAKAATIALLASGMAAGGFLVGQRNQSAKTSAIAVDSSRPPRKDSPWARYRLVSEQGRGGMQIVRVETANEKEGALQ